MFKIGDKVRIPNHIRDKCSLRHLTGEYTIRAMDGDYVIFYTGEPINSNTGLCPIWQQRWRKTNLIHVGINLENK